MINVSIASASAVKVSTAEQQTVAVTAALGSTIRGYSAYQVAVLEGFEGTEAEWLDSLIGPMGPPGPPGESITNTELEEMLK